MESRGEVLDGNGLLPGVLDKFGKVVTKFVDLIDRVGFLEALEYECAAAFSIGDRC